MSVARARGAPYLCQSSSCGNYRKFLLSNDRLEHPAAPLMPEGTPSEDQVRSSQVLPMQTFRTTPGASRHAARSRGTFKRTTSISSGRSARSNASWSTAPGWIVRPSRTGGFGEFVEATGYVTFAEIAPKPEDYPGALPHMLKAGSLLAFVSGINPSTYAISRIQSSGSSAPTGAALMVQGAFDPRSRRSPCCAHFVPGCRSLRRLGGQATTDRSRVGTYAHAVVFDRAEYAGR